MFYTDDPIRDAERYQADQDRQLAELPVCCYCGESIQDDHYFLINDEAYCQDCMEDQFKKRTEDYIG